MQLQEWLKKQRMSQKAFARLIKSDQPHISELINRRHRPSLGTIGRIAVVTKGQVTWADWMQPYKKAMGKAAR